MDALDAEKISSLLKGSRFSRKIIVSRSLPSTNNRAKELYKQGAEDSTVILAEEQTAGRGRMNRVWVSPPGKNILVSLLFRPSIKIERVYTLTLALALSVADSVKKMTGLPAMIKWPNDIYLNNKKLGGILTEFGAKGSIVEYVILGLGLNVDWCPGAEAMFPSACLNIESGRRLSRNELLASILLKYDNLYEGILSGHPEEFHKKCNERSLINGKKVTIDAQGEIITGTASGIDIDGALLVREQGGGIRKVLNGDVSLRS